MSQTVSNKTADDRFRNCRDFPFKLCIIGGGPSGCSVIVRAVRTGNIEKLCGIDEESNLSGVCVIDRGSLERFGGGRLQDYSINSNTFAVKFATNVLDDKYESLPPEVCTGSYFEKLRTSENCKRLHEYGNKQGSLQIVGGFLHDVGTTVVETLAQYPATCSCLTDTTVNSAERYVRGDGLLGWKLSILTTGKELTYIYAKDVLFATGGRQETPILANSAHNCKVLGSDFVCTEEGIDEVRRRILKSIRTSGKRKVVIVGGSHSAFSAAWMCLHKLDLSVKEDSTLIPTPIATATLTATTATATLTTAVTATVTATTTATVTATPSETESEKASAHTDIGIDTDTGIDTHCCGSPLRTAASSPSKPPKSPSYQSLNQETTDEMSNVIVAATSPSKSSVCKIKEREKMKQKLFTKSDSISTKGMTGQSDVLILHRSYIKVFYSTKREADYDLYYDTGVINKSTGQIHPFGGLRGDSKSLWRDIKCGRENRVRLVALRAGVDVTQQSIGAKLFDEAAVIVWACGYKTNMCPVYESDGLTPIPLGYYRGQVEVDDLARILTSKTQDTVTVPVSVPVRFSSPPNGIISTANNVEGIIRSRDIERSSSHVDIDISTSTHRNSEDKRRDESQDGRGGSQDGITDEEFESHSDRGSQDAYTAQATIFQSSSQDSSVYDTLQPPAVPVPASASVDCSIDAVATIALDREVIAASRTPELTAPTGMKHPLSPSSSLPPPHPHTTARITSAAVPCSTFSPVGGLLGSGMGFGLKAILDNGEADGSSGRADGVAVYLKHGATLVLAHVLGPTVYGEGITSWEDRSAAMRKLALALQSHPPPRSQLSKVEIVMGSDAEGLDNAYCQRTLTLSFVVPSSKSPTSNNSSSNSDPPSPLSLHSPRRDRRRGESCCRTRTKSRTRGRRVSSPSPSIESNPCTTRSDQAQDQDLGPLSRVSPTRALPSSNSAPSTARKSNSQPDAQQAHTSRAAGNASAAHRSVSPPPSLFLHRAAVLPEQQALGVTRLSAPRSILVTKPKTPPPVTVFLGEEAIQASVSRLSACPARSVTAHETQQLQPHHEGIAKKNSYSKSVTTSACADNSSSSIHKKTTSSGRGKRIKMLPSREQSVSPIIAERLPTETPTTPSRSLPHRRAILQSEALSKDVTILISSPSNSNSVSEVTGEVKSSSQISVNRENDKVRITRRSISVPPTCRASRKIVQVPMPLKSVMIELDITGRDILRVGPPINQHAGGSGGGGSGSGGGGGGGGASEETKTPWSSAVTENHRQQKYKQVERMRLKGGSRGTQMSSSVPTDFFDLGGCNRVGQSTTKSSATLDGNTTSMK